ncbi:hypothetical protein FHR70_004359 [Microvirga lupini]|uniref:Uncharacterized protein n=1 Tax=Microvirga lupini TaxID=420324 RepID=A0A7W4VQ78_9HYPH|nr:hypothetical protein [Microvirga lupini]MBB3021268.1 hypothetical protein [Microvirga lupini]
MEDLFSVKLTETEVARAKSASRKFALLALLMFCAVPVSFFISLVLRGKVSSFNPIVDAYLMPALYNLNPNLWRFINYGFTTNLRYGAEYLLIGWSASVLIGAVTAFVAVSVVRKIDLGYFIFNSQEQKRRLIHGLGYEFLILLFCLGLAAFCLFITHEGDFVAHYRRNGRKWELIYVWIPIAYPIVVLFLLISAIQMKKMYLLVRQRLKRNY